MLLIEPVHYLRYKTSEFKIGKAIDSVDCQSCHKICKT